MQFWPGTEFFETMQNYYFLQASNYSAKKSHDFVEKQLL